MDRPPTSIVRRDEVYFLELWPIQSCCASGNCRAALGFDGRGRPVPTGDSRAGTPGSPLTGTSMKKLAVLILAVSLSVHCLVAQSVSQSVNSLLKPGTQPQAASSASADPLGRATPSGTVLGFL